MFGKFLKWLINLWMLVLGKIVAFKDYPWLDGPMAEGNVVGDKFYELYANNAGLVTSVAADGGLVADFRAVIPANDPFRDRLNARIVHFYEHTAEYKLEVWSQWFSPVSIFFKILISCVSAEMEQLNIPLNPLETSRGMSNEVLHLNDPVSGMVRYACWLRKSLQSGKVVYAGFYSGCVSGGKPFVRVVFPLPGGNVTVLLRVEVQDDGSVKLISNGRGIGDAGYYRVRKYNKDSVKIRYIPIKEGIHVFEDEAGVLRTDHLFYMWKIKFLHLHYKILPKTGTV
jgi:hypothetical protein